MALTKSAGLLCDWTAVAQNTTWLAGESSAYSIDWSDAYGGLVVIQAFLTADNTVHSGTEFLIQGRAATTDTNEDWYDICRFVDLVATNQDIEINEEVTTDEQAVGVEENPTTLFPSGTTDGPLKWGGYVDETIADCEIVLVGKADADEVFLVASNHAGTEYLEAAHTDADSINITAMSRGIPIDIDHVRVRVVVNNTYDVNGSTLNVRVKYTKVTAL